MGRRLLLLRHGETYEPRLDAPMAGPEEDPQLPLTERGRDRLREVATWIAKAPIEHAYASPFLRAQQTAEIVTQPHGLAIGTLDALAELPLYPPPGGTLRDVAHRYIGLVRDLAERAPHEVLLDGERSLGSILDDAPRCDPGHDGNGHRHGADRRARRAQSFPARHWLGIPPARAIGIEQNFACVNVVEFVGSGHPWVRALNVTLHDPLKSDSRGI